MKSSTRRAKLATLASLPKPRSTWALPHLGAAWQAQQAWWRRSLPCGPRMAATLCCSSGMKKLGEKGGVGVGASAWEPDRALRGRMSGTKERKWRMKARVWLHFVWCEIDFVCRIRSNISVVVRTILLGYKHISSLARRAKPGSARRWNDSETLARLGLLDSGVRPSCRAGMRSGWTHARTHKNTNMHKNAQGKQRMVSTLIGGLRGRDGFRLWLLAHSLSGP